MLFLKDTPFSCFSVFERRPVKLLRWSSCRTNFPWTIAACLAVGTLPHFAIWVNLPWSLSSSFSSSSSQILAEISCFNVHLSIHLFNQKLPHIEQQIVLVANFPNSNKYWGRYSDSAMTGEHFCGDADPVAHAHLHAYVHAHTHVNAQVMVILVEEGTSHW